MNNPQAFHGSLTPTPNTFTIEVRRLIIRDDSIAYDIEGVSEGDRYHCSGELEKHDCYYRGRVEYDNGCHAYLYVLEIDIDSDSCSIIDGVWLESDGPYGHGWQFGGTLRRLQNPET